MGSLQVGVDGGDQASVVNHKVGMYRVTWSIEAQMF